MATNGALVHSKLPNRVIVPKNVLAAEKSINGVKWGGLLQGFVFLVFMWVIKEVESDLICNHKVYVSILHSIM